MDRGYFGIGIWCPKSDCNVGTLCRTAMSYDASFLFTVGRRMMKQASDTTKSHRHIATYNYKDLIDLKEHLPFGCQLIGIEMDERAKSLDQFIHPEQGCYILGADDNGLPDKVREACVKIVQVPMAAPLCLNVATAGAMVMYDRFVKTGQGLWKARAA